VNADHGGGITMLVAVMVVITEIPTFRLMDKMIVTEELVVDGIGIGIGIGIEGEVGKRETESETEGETGNVNVGETMSESVIETGESVAIQLGLAGAQAETVKDRKTVTVGRIYIQIEWKQEMNYTVFIIIIVWQAGWVCIILSIFQMHIFFRYFLFIFSICMFFWGWGKNMYLESILLKIYYYIWGIV
jgi:hypothetical protein